MENAVFDPNLFAPARFPGFDAFPHFEDPDHPKCFTCNSRLMHVRPVTFTPKFTLLPATHRLDNGKFVVIPKSWGLYPREHLTTLGQMPDDWMASKKAAALILGITDTTPCFTGENWTPAAGQTIEHGHTWFTLRDVVAERGLLCAGVGPTTIIMRIRALGLEWPAS